MAVDGIILYQQLKTLYPLLPARINKITQPSDSEVLLVIRHNSVNYQLLLCVHSQYNRINISKLNYHNPTTPSSFIMLLRKHLENGLITEIVQDELDRCVILTILKNNEVAELQTSYLYLELMGKYANLILANQNNIIVDAIKRIHPYENSKRIIFAGAQYKANYREKRQNPLLNDKVAVDQPLIQQFEGFSPLLAREVEYRLVHGENFKSIMQELEDSFSIFYYPESKIYHVIQLKHLNQTFQIMDINNGFDILYADMQDKLRVEQFTGNLFRYVKSEHKKNLNKLPKLKQSYQEACDNEKWRIGGDLIFANLHLLKKGMTSVDLFDYQTNTKKTLPLQAKLDPKQNGQKYYRNYRKAKNGQQHLIKQIEHCESQITYFESLSQQLEIADLPTALEIQDELIKLGYLKTKNTKKNKAKKSQPKYSTFTCEKATIFVGHNNTQNEYVTFKLAKKEDTWFHVQKLHGSHVIITTAIPNEKQIRFCANLAAYYSKSRYSSSVPVDYTLVKNIKKIPKSSIGQVSISDYKTIYIDPEKPD